MRTWEDYVARPTDSFSDLPSLRPQLAARLGQSEIPEMRMAASVMVQDPLLRKKDGMVVAAPESGAAWARRTSRRYVAEVNTEAKQHIDAFAERNAINWINRPAAEVKFQNAVGWALGGAPTQAVGPEAQAVAGIYRRQFARLLAMAKRHGVRGFENIPEDPNYFPHFHSVGKVHAAVKDWGEDAIADLYRLGMIGAGMDPDIAAKAAPGFLRAIRDIGSISELQKIQMFAGDTETIKSVFKQFATDITDSEAEKIAEYLRPSGAGVHARARRRVGLDTMVKITRATRNGKPEDLWLHQLIETNASAVFSKYARQIIGASAEAEVLRSMSIAVYPDGRNEFKTFDGLLEYLKQRHTDAGIRTDVGVGKRNMERLAFARRAMVGIPLNEPGIANDIARLLNSWNFIRLSGRFGAAQLQEFGAVLGEFGMVDTVAKLPELGRTFARAANGRLTNEFLDEVEHFVGIVSDNNVHTLSSHFDNDGFVEEFVSDGIKRAVQRGERYAGNISGLIPITIMQQHAAAEMAGSKLLKIALGGRPLGQKRMLVLGMEAPMWERVAGQIRKHVETVDGMTGRRVRRFNFSAWEDTEAASSLITALDRWSSRVTIQDTDVGALMPWMTHPMARLLLQFRMFSLQQWEKGFLRGVQLNDRQAYLRWVYQGIAGSLVYAATQYAMSIGNKERQKKLAERLSAKNIALQGFSRSGLAGVLSPVVDTGLQITGNDPVFSNRFTGVASGVIGGNPTVSGADDIGKFLEGVGQLVQGRGMSRSEALAGTNLLPFQSVFGVRNVLDKMVDDLPRRSRR